MDVIPDRLTQIDARVDFLRELYAAGEVDPEELEREVRALAVERVALLGGDEGEYEPDPDEGVGVVLPVSPAGLTVAERVDRLVDFAAAVCVAWRQYRTGG